MTLIVAPLDYAAPDTLEGVLTLLAARPGARLLAGGHDLVPELKAGTVTPPLLVDLRKIGSLRPITYDEKGGRIVIGAMATLAQILAHPGPADPLPALQQAAAAVGDAQVRNASTLGGTLASRHPAADLAAPVLVFDARISVQGPHGERTVSAADLLSSESSPLQPEEIITSVEFPASDKNTGSAYVKQTIPATCYPLCGVAARVVLKSQKVTDCRVAATGVFARPTRLKGVEGAVVGTIPSRDSLSRASAAEDGEPARTDLAGSGAYRLHLLGILTLRALVGAVERAGLHLE
jgi:carbon-monoxide dehydrogenase medium subunit